VKISLPTLVSIKNYNKQTFKDDAIAGLTVGIVLIPQAISYAFLAGVPPIYGLYSCLVPLLIYAILGTSRHLSVGPVAVTSILLMTGISVIAEPFTEAYVSLLLVTGFLVGITQVLMGVLRLGFLVNVLAQPVISGFISAAAIIIIISQFRSGLAITPPPKSNSLQAIIYLFKHLKDIHIPSLGITVSSVSTMLIAKKWNRKFPTSLLLIVIFTISSYVFDFSEYGIAIIGEIPKGLPSFTIPEFDFNTIKPLTSTIFTLTLIGYLGSIGIAKSFQMKHRNYQVNPNQELIALGLSKVVGTFFQGNLVSGSYSRSAINEDAGAKTNLAAIATVIIISLSLVFLTPYLYYLPKPVLASIILVSVFSLIKVKEAHRYLKIKTSDFLIMISTFIITLSISIETGILTGMILSFIVQQYQSSKPHIAELAKIPNTNYYRNLTRFPEAVNDPHTIILRFDDQLYFGNADYFKESIYKYVEKGGEELRYIVLHATNIHSLDSTGVHTLEDLCDELKSKGINILFSGMIGPVRDILTRAGFISKFGKQQHFMNIHDAMVYIETGDRLVNEYSNPTLQHNKRKIFSLKNIFSFLRKT